VHVLGRVRGLYPQRDPFQGETEDFSFYDQINAVFEIDTQ